MFSVQKSMCMKRSFLQISILIVIFVFAFTGLSFETEANFSKYKLSSEGICYYVPNEDEILSTSNQDQTYSLFLGKGFIGFKEALGFKESQGNYLTVNQFGYLGKYQFNRNTLSMIGFKNTQNFLTNSQMQEMAFEAYTSKNKWILRRDIKRYVGRYVGGVYITESGVLAAAHLAGAGNVKKFLRSGGTYNFSDAFGTSIRYYLKKFSGYDTSFIKPEKNPYTM